MTCLWCVSQGPHGLHSPSPSHLTCSCLITSPCGDSYSVAPPASLSGSKSFWGKSLDSPHLSSRRQGYSRRVQRLLCLALSPGPGLAEGKLFHIDRWEELRCPGGLLHLSSLLQYFLRHQKAESGKPGSRHLDWMPTCLGAREGDACPSWPILGFLLRLLVGMNSQLRDELGATAADLPVISERPQEEPAGSP